MRHNVAKVRLSRSTSHRVAMMRNMVTSLIEHERIETTLAKAKQLKMLADRMVTLGKEGTLHSRRRALAIVRKKSAVSKLFTILADRFKERTGGYTRVLKLGFRHGDAAPMALIEYLGYTSKKESKVELKETTEKKKPKVKATKKAVEKKPKAEKKKATTRKKNEDKPE